MESGSDGAETVGAGVVDDGSEAASDTVDVVVDGYFDTVQAFYQVVAADAALKTITVISLAGVEPKPLGQTLPVVEKKLAIDVLPAMRQSHGWISDKLEGMAVLANGELVAVTDNDGVDGATGETLFLRLGATELVD